MDQVKYKQLVIGALLGSMITGAGAVAASDSNEITAFVKNEIIFKFNGTEKKLDDGYSVISYKNSTYVPARFVAEELGAKVNWNSEMQTISIDSASEPKDTVVTDAVYGAQETQETKPSGQAGDWDKYDGVWSAKDVTAKLDFISATRAEVELASTAQPELNGVKFTTEFNDGGRRSGLVNLKDKDFIFDLIAVNEQLIITIDDTTKRIVYKEAFRGSTPLPYSGSTTNIANYAGKWTRARESLTISVDGTAVKIAYNNQDSDGLFSFTADLQSFAGISANGHITKDGTDYSVQLGFGQDKVMLIVVNPSAHTVSSVEFTTKE